MCQSGATCRPIFYRHSWKISPLTLNNRHPIKPLEIEYLKRWKIKDIALSLSWYCHIAFMKKKKTVLLLLIIGMISFLHLKTRRRMNLYFFNIYIYIYIHFIFFLQKEDDDFLDMLGQMHEIEEINLNSAR